MKGSEDMAKQETHDSREICTTMMKFLLDSQNSSPNLTQRLQEIMSMGPTRASTLRTSHYIGDHWGANALSSQADLELSGPSFPTHYFCDALWKFMVICLCVSLFSN